MTDNARSWDRIAQAYQRGRGWPHESLFWGVRCPPEESLRILDDVRGRRVLVLGCGGGQDCVALARLGAAEVVGVDASREQLEHARRLVGEQGFGCRLVEGNIEELAGFGDGAFDTVVSVHVLTYVEHAGRCFAEAKRVLRPGGQLAFSVHHPFDASTVDDPPYGLLKPYFQVEQDWSWSSLGGDEARFRSWHRTVADWFALLVEAGFTVERLLEPRPFDHPVWRTSGWAVPPYWDKLATIPGTLIFSARGCSRPGGTPP